MPNIIEITDFHAPELDPYARLTQNQLRNHPIAYIADGINIKMT